MTSRDVSYRIRCDCCDLTGMCTLHFTLKDGLKPPATSAVDVLSTDRVRSSME